MLICETALSPYNLINRESERQTVRNTDIESGRQRERQTYVYK